jgi:hypothetical protein
MSQDTAAPMDVDVVEVVEVVDVNRKIEKVPLLKLQWLLE